MPGALFIPAGSGFDPTELAIGPWRHDAQHGGPPSALLAHLTESEVSDNQFVAFIEVELTKPVPLSLLTTEVSVEVLSRRVSRVRAALLSEGIVVCRSSALVLATEEDLPSPNHVAPAPEPVAIPGPDAVEIPPPFGAHTGTAYHRNGVEHRFARGTFTTAGPAFSWVRLRQPVVAGAELTGLQRLLAAADFGSGISAIYDASTSVGLINANLAVTVRRSPVGQWIGLDSETLLDPNGIGTATTTLHDELGIVATATQSLIPIRRLTP